MTRQKLLSGSPFESVLTRPLLPVTSKKMASVNGKVSRERRLAILSLIRHQIGFLVYMSNRPTLAALTSLSRMSDADLLFCLALSNLSSLILIQPFSPSLLSSLINSFLPGFPGVHLGPARSLNLWTASDVDNGRAVMGTRRTHLVW